ncbi:carbohydrate ABC transporter permease [Brachybacterium sp. AOP43-C2-M15]|uniref:carbohydrate ABC transporter permease n=1 Tax=Brachybacterium sp. AOP43-C2-M15 TaxID=3457661 RepID=UPI0040344633
MILRDSLPVKLVRIGGLTLWLLITIFPLYWILISSLKTPADIATYPVQYLPLRPTLQNYVSLFENSSFAQNMLSSLVVATVAGLAATAIATLSAYVLSRFTFKARSLVVLAFLVTQMIPAFIALGPLYQMMVAFGLVDNRGGLALVYVAMCIPFSSIMLKGFFDNVPDELDEAAMIDGCSRLVALVRIILPVMLPGLAATFIFNFVNCWNELFLSVTLLNSSDKRTIPTALNGFITSFNVEWGPLSAAAVLTVIPTMVLFGIASKWIVAGLTAGATKG